MTNSPSIRAPAAPSLPLGGTTGAAAIAQGDQPQDSHRGNTQDDVAVIADPSETLWADMLWHAKQGQTDWNEAEHQRIQRQVAALALGSAPTINGREAVLRQMESLRHGLNEQGVALVTRKTAVALEVNAVSLTRPEREAALLRVF